MEPQQSQAAPPQKANRFFRNYNRLVGGTYVAILLLTGIFFVYQVQEKHDEEVRIIRGHVQRHAQFVEFILRSSLDSLEAMRISANESYRAARAAPKAAATAPLFGTLRQTPAGFDLDGARERDASGNVVGLGSLANRPPAFYSDLYVALNLGPVLQAIALNLPNASRAGFTSREHFSNIYPWVERDKRPFTDEVYASPLWQLGTPAVDRNREKYWAPVHYEGAENGLLVPTAAPIYDGDEFRGVAFIDTSLDYLNRINGEFGYSGGTVFLVDAYGEVVAHPQLYSDALNVKATRPVSDVLPAGILAPGKKLSDLPADQPLTLGGHLVMRHAFVSAPWDLVYVVPSQQLWLGLLRERGPLMLLIIVALTLLMVVTYLVSTREFIMPASQLVAHIAAESQFTPMPIPRVPSTWRPWFDTISQVFRESLQLAGIRQELDIAAKMQQSILPRHWPEKQDFALWGVMRSAKEVGGDFYDHFPVEGGRIGIVVADVSGKGVPAALFGMVSKTLLRATAARFGPKLGDAIAAANDVLCEDNDACIFVTVLYAVYDPPSRRLDFVNAGHPAPLLVHADGSSEFLPMTGGTALGVMDGIPFTQASVILEPGDCVLMYSDGVTEAMSPANEEFTPARLPELFGGATHQDVRAAVQRVVDAVDAHADGAPQSDDITCLALLCQTTAAATPRTAIGEPQAVEES
jgi:phosphoserine phosphatase RsbU/P